MPDQVSVSQASSQQDRFPQFVDFPKEIQDLIWDAAVRPVPGIRHLHRFTVADQFVKKSDLRNGGLGSFVRFGENGRVNAGFNLAVPGDSAEYGRNDSVYLTDSGLWTACRASRAAMERYFGKNEWWSDVPDATRPRRLAKAGAYFNEPDAFHTTSYRDASGEFRHITISAGNDIILFQSPGLGAVDWFHHYAWNDVPLVDYRGYHNQAPSSSFIGMDVAFEYHPLMLNLMSRQPMTLCRHLSLEFSSGALIDMLDVFHEHSVRTIWFIDPRLRRRNPSVKTQSSGRTYRSADWIYTEVLREHLADWTVHSSDPDAQDEGKSPLVDELNKNTPFDLFDILESASNGCLSTDNSDRLRVLACEAAPGVAQPIQRRQVVESLRCETCVAELETPVVRRRFNSLQAGGDDVWDDIDEEDLRLFD